VVFIPDSRAATFIVLSRGLSYNVESASYLFLALSNRCKAIRIIEGIDAYMSAALLISCVERASSGDRGKLRDEEPLGFV
jgi:hypothetical protein